MKTSSVLKVLAGLIVLLVLLFVVPVERAPAAPPDVTLDWTAPGDDGTVGTASTYEMRMSTTRPDTTGWAASPTKRTAAMDSWWNSATVVSGLPNPQVAGTRQTVVVTQGIVYATTYYFLLKACDDGLPTNNVVGGVPTPIPNCSGYSNLASKNTGPAPDLQAPATIIDLIAR